MTKEKFDLKLIPGFNSSASGPSVIEWIEKADLVCKMYQVKYPGYIVPLRLMWSAFAVYQQLKKKRKGGFQPDKICTVHFLLYEQFAEQCFCSRESVGFYLVKFWKFSVLFGV